MQSYYIFINYKINTRYIKVEVHPKPVKFQSEFPAQKIYFDASVVWNYRNLNVNENRKCAWTTGVWNFINQIIKKKLHVW